MIDSRIKFRHLQCFLATAQLGSVQKAADRLAITQPAVSKTLQELETLVSARLLERGRRGAQLTPQGEAFMRHAETSVNALREAVASVSPASRAATSRIHIGVLPTVAPWLLPRLLQALDEKNDTTASAPTARRLNLQLHTGPNPALLSQLRSGSLDLVIGRFAEPAHMLGLSFEHLYADPLVLAVRPGHPLQPANSKKPKPVAMTVLSAYPWVLPLPGTAIRHTADSFLSKHGLAVTCRLETLDVTVARSYTAQSNAIWLTPQGAVEDEFKAGHLAALKADMRGTEEMVGLTLRADMQANAAQQEVITAIHELAAARRSAAAGE